MGRPARIAAEGLLRVVAVAASAWALRIEILWQATLSPYLICPKMCSAPERSAVPGCGSMFSSFTTPSLTSIE